MRILITYMMYFRPVGAGYGTVLSVYFKSASGRSIRHDPGSGRIAIKGDQRHPEQTQRLTIQAGPALHGNALFIGQPATAAQPVQQQPGPLAKVGIPGTQPGTRRPDLCRPAKPIRMFLLLLRAPDTKLVPQ